MGVAQDTILDCITNELADHYYTNKDSERELKRVRAAFFEALNQELETTSLRTQVIHLPEDFEDDYIAKHFPGWRVQLWDEEGAMVLEEDPAFLKHSYTSERLGLVFTRNITQGTPELDDARLREEDPELWHRITTCPAEEVLQDLINWVSGEIVPNTVRRYIEKMGRSFERRLKDLHDLPQEDLSKLAGYLIPGKLTVKLEPPRKIKPEEIDDE